MQNPVLNNRNSIVAYLIVWFLVICIQVLLLSLSTNIPLYIAIGEGIVANVLFAAIGLGLWFPVFYGKPAYEKISNFIIRHIFACLTSIAIWIGIQYAILDSLFGSNQEYLAYLRKSITWKAGTGILYYWLIILVYYLLIYYRNMKISLVKEAELKTLIREAELSSLKSQINPHFLFNSLNSISSLTMIHPEKAQEMIIKLSEFLRYSVSNKDENLTSLHEEIKNVNRYLDIEKIRFGKRLIINQKIDDMALDMKVPGLLLQPLIENAIKYSIYENPDPATIDLICRSQSDILLVTVRNPYDPDAKYQRGAGLGLQNIRTRLKILYNREDLIAIHKENNVFEIQIVLPQLKNS